MFESNLWLYPFNLYFILHLKIWHNKKFRKYACNNKSRSISKITKNIMTNLLYTVITWFYCDSKMYNIMNTSIIFLFINIIFVMNQDSVYPSSSKTLMDLCPMVITSLVNIMHIFFVVWLYAQYLTVKTLQYYYTWGREVLLRAKAIKSYSLVVPIGKTKFLNNRVRQNANFIRSVWSVCFVFTK